MAFRSPPEFLLRNAIRANSCARRISKHEMSSGGKYRNATLVEVGKPIEILTSEPGNVPSGHVRLAIHACGVNFADILMAKGQYQVKPTLPFVGGNEACGQVLELGSDVDNVKVGEKVFTLLNNGGGFSEQAIVPALSLFPLPEGVPYVAGASFLISYCTAYLALTRKANIQEGETVLVTAGAGATGLATVDLAANVFNCTVIAACGSEEKCKVAKSRGAKYTIDYSKDSIRTKTKEYTNGEGADIIVDMVGGDIWNECVRSVAFEGRMIVIGFASGKIPTMPTNSLLIKSCSAVGLWWGNYAMRGQPAFFQSITDIARLLGENKLNPLTGATFPLAKINEAFDFVLQRKSTGKVVIETRK